MLRRIAPIVAAGVLLTACGGSDTDSSPAASESSITEPTAVVDPVPDAAPGSSIDGGSAVIPPTAPEILQFTAPLIGGGDIEAASLAERPVLLWFWSPW